MKEEFSKSPDNFSSRDRPETVTPVNVINAEEVFSGNCDMDLMQKIIPKLTWSFLF
ncbi:hypothetical protein Hanom_Chr10g00942101 [Helianthus anomalus]